jgi:hypothetical protein
MAILSRGLAVVPFADPKRVADGTREKAECMFACDCGAFGRNKIADRRGGNKMEILDDRFAEPEHRLRLVAEGRDVPVPGTILDLLPHLERVPAGWTRYADGSSCIRNVGSR